MYVDFPENTHVFAADFDSSGGNGGRGGEGGEGGDAGRGGEAGDPCRPHCWPHEDWAGDPGEEEGSSGSYGDPGEDGDPGKSGLDNTSQITLAQWQEWFTKPYLLKASPTDGQYVGGTFTIETANISGGVTLTAVDVAKRAEAEASFNPNAKPGVNIDPREYTYTVDLVELGGGTYPWSADNEYEWTIDTWETHREERPGTWTKTTVETTAGRYELTLTRHSDGEVSNSYAVDVLPVIDGVQFLDDFDARPGGTAYLVGLGLRSDADIILDGERDELDGERLDIDEYHTSEEKAGFGEGSTEGLFGDRDWLQFTIPVDAADGDFFLHDELGAAYGVSGTDVPARLR